MDLNIVRHCNNWCAFCTHGSPLADHYFMPPATLARDLAILEPILLSKRVILLGGEPLMHPDLLGIMKVLADSKVPVQKEILSNGRLLFDMPDEFFAACERWKFSICVTVYENLDAEKLGAFLGEKQKRYSLSVGLNRTTDFVKFCDHKKDGKGQDNFDHCCWSRCYTLHDGWLYCCPTSAFLFQQLFPDAGHQEGIPLDGITEAKLQDFIMRKVTPRMCDHCAGSNGPSVPWHQTFGPGKWKDEVLS